MAGTQRAEGTTEPLGVTWNQTGGERRDTATPAPPRGAIRIHKNRDLGASLRAGTRHAPTVYRALPQATGVRAALMRLL